VQLPAADVGEIARPFTVEIECYAASSESMADNSREAHGAPQPPEQTATPPPAQAPAPPVPASNIATVCLPFEPSGSDPIVSIDVGIGMTNGGSSWASFEVHHHSSRGNVYSRADQYSIVQGLATKNAWQWRGYRRQQDGAIIWMIGELNPTEGVQQFRYRYREWIFHGDPSVIGVKNGELVTNAMCGTRAAVKMRVIEDLTLRAHPDRRSDDLLSRWSPENFIPTGAIFVWTTRDRKCQPAPDGQGWCYPTYAHHGIKTSGWVADRYLEEVVP
jgi:hypothetical protein